MKSINMTAKDLINAKSSSVPVKTAPPRFKATGFAIAEDVDKESGEVREVGYIVAEDQTVYGTISNTAISTISDIIAAVEENTFDLPVEIGVSLRKSNGGREFITLSVF